MNATDHEASKINTSNFPEEWEVPLDTPPLPKPTKMKKSPLPPKGNKWQRRKEVNQENQDFDFFARKSG